MLDFAWIVLSGRHARQLTMADFVCKVGDASGRVFQQVETAQSEEEARQKLADRGYYVFAVRSQLDLFSRLAQGGGHKIRLDDFLIFNQQFHTLVRAGLPILKALDLLTERAGTARLRPTLEDVRQRVRAGALLSVRSSLPVSTTGSSESSSVIRSALAAPRPSVAASLESARTGSSKAVR